MEPSWGDWRIPAGLFECLLAQSHPVAVRLFSSHGLGARKPGLALAIGPASLGGLAHPGGRKGKPRQQVQHVFEPLLPGSPAQGLLG